MTAKMQARSFATWATWRSASGTLIMSDNGSSLQVKGSPSIGIRIGFLLPPKFSGFGYWPERAETAGSSSLVSLFCSTVEMWQQISTRQELLPCTNTSVLDLVQVNRLPLPILSLHIAGVHSYMFLTHYANGSHPRCSVFV